MRKEELIYPPTVFSYNWLDENGKALPNHGKVGREIPYSLYHDAVQNRKVGDHITQHAAAPGCGSVTYEITRIDNTGVYGVMLKNTIRELRPEEVI